METDVLYSIGQLAKEVPELVAVNASGQKVSALVKQLKDAGLVMRVEEKRKAFFKRA
jgi:DNA-binding transcriptional regulator GbsR (MarR family)